MSDLYLVTTSQLPKRVCGSYSRYSLGTLDKSKLLRIEDRLFSDGQRIAIPNTSGCIVVPDITDASVDETIAVCEFGLALLTVAGHPSFRLAALFSGTRCVRAWMLPERFVPTAEFVDTVTGKAAAQWLSRCILSMTKLKERLHITARRYVRFATASDEADGLLDLCISLESLLDSQSEVSFRFGISLVKACEKRGTEASEAADLLSDLYDVRSKLAHGDPCALKKVRLLTPHLPALRQLANHILTVYILYTSEHSRDDWKKHLKEKLFA